MGHEDDAPTISRGQTARGEPEVCAPKWRTTSETGRPGTAHRLRLADRGHEPAREAAGRAFPTTPRRCLPGRYSLLPIPGGRPAFAGLATILRTVFADLTALNRAPAIVRCRHAELARQAKVR
jgi:hypothetical protein